MGANNINEEHSALLLFVPTPARVSFLPFVFSPGQPASQPAAPRIKWRIWGVKCMSVSRGCRACNSGDGGNGGGGRAWSERSGSGNGLELQESTWRSLATCRRPPLAKH